MDLQPIKAGAKAYLAKAVVPSLVEGMTKLSIARPTDPHVWLAQFLLDKSGSKATHILIEASKIEELRAALESSSDANSDLTAELRRTQRKLKHAEEDARRAEEDAANASRRQLLVPSTPAGSSIDAVRALGSPGGGMGGGMFGTMGGSSSHNLAQGYSDSPLPWLLVAPDGRAFPERLAMLRVEAVSARAWGHPTMDSHALNGCLQRFPTRALNAMLSQELAQAQHAQQGGASGMGMGMEMGTGMGVGMGGNNMLVAWGDREASIFAHDIRVTERLLERKTLLIAGELGETLRHGSLAAYSGSGGGGGGSVSGSGGRHARVAQLVDELACIPVALAELERQTRLSAGGADPAFTAGADGLNSIQGAQFTAAIGGDGSAAPSGWKGARMRFTRVFAAVGGHKTPQPPRGYGGCENRLHWLQERCVKETAEGARRREIGGAY
jgi:hypothetical protein